MANSQITMNVFLLELKKRLSDSNAKLLLHSAVVNTGINCASDEPMNKEEAHNLCMELIKFGGPGFQAGRTVYTQLSK